MQNVLIRQVLEIGNSRRITPTASKKTGVVRPLPDKTGYYRLWSVFTSFFIVFFYKGTNNIVRGLSEEEKNVYTFFFLSREAEIGRYSPWFEIKERKRVKTMNTKYKLSFYLNDTEYAQLSVRAKACNMSINAYAKQLALDETDCIKLKRGTATTMAKLYAWSELTTDLAARKFMREAGDLLWQSLK